MKSSFLTVRHLLVEGYTEPHQIEPYCYPVFSYSFLLEGEVLASIDGKNILISAGQFILVPENKTIVIKHFKGCRGFTGGFTLDELKDSSYPVLRSKEPALQSFWFDDAVFMAALLKRMMVAFNEKDKAFVRSGMDLILSQLRPTGQVAAIPEKFLQMVFEKEHTMLSVADYAQQLRVTPNYLNKTVKAHTRRTAIDWIEIARLNLAKKLLKDNEIPIADVARLSGLDDQSYFSRFFKKKTGLTPSQYRNNGEKGHSL